MAPLSPLATTMPWWFIYCFLPQKKVKIQRDWKVWLQLCLYHVHRFRDMCVECCPQVHWLLLVRWHIREQPRSKDTLFVFGWIYTDHLHFFRWLFKNFEFCLSSVLCGSKSLTSASYWKYFDNHINWLEQTDRMTNTFAAKMSCTDILTFVRLRLALQLTVQVLCF